VLRFGTNSSGTDMPGLNLYIEGLGERQDSVGKGFASFACSLFFRGSCVLSTGWWWSAFRTKAFATT
jgi:hypothetical protein